MHRRSLALLALVSLTSALLFSGAPTANAQDAPPQAVGALSPEQVQAWREGRGMGMGQVAMQHGYPGPRHVLAQAEALGLSDEQRAASAQLMAAMKSEAVALSGRIVELEGELDARFAAGDIDAATLERLVTEIGQLQARVRLAHLGAHLGQYQLLSAEQRAQLEQRSGHAGMHGGRGAGGGHGQHQGHNHPGQHAAGSCAHGRGDSGGGCGGCSGADGEGCGCGCGGADGDHRHGHGAGHGCGCGCGAGSDGDCGCACGKGKAGGCSAGGNGGCGCSGQGAHRQRSAPDGG